MVGIADDQFAVRRRADQQVNAVLLQVRRVPQDLCLHRSSFRQVGKRAVMHATQSSEQCVLQIQVDLRPGAKHLQTTDLRVERGNRLSQKGLIVVTGADDDLLGKEAAGSAVQAAGLNVAHQGGEVKLDAQFAAQVVDQRWNCFARIQLLIDYLR